MTQDFRMPSRSDSCGVCQRAFEPLESFRAHLFDAPEGYVRLDLCTGCELPADRTPVASWRARKPPAGPPRAVLDRQAMHELLVQMGSATEPSRLRFRFALALFLWRKKVVQFVSADDSEGGETWNFTSTLTEESILVQRPELDEQQLDDLSATLERALMGELPPMEATGMDSEASHA